MSDLIQELDSILSPFSILKNNELELTNDLLTKAINATLPSPNSYIEDIILFDIEFYTIANYIISQFGFISNNFEDTADLTREISLMVLRKTYIPPSISSVVVPKNVSPKNIVQPSALGFHWTIKRLYFFNTNNEFLYRTLRAIRINYSESFKNNQNIKGPYLRTLSTSFMSIDKNQYEIDLLTNLNKKSSIKNNNDFVNKLKKKNETIPINNDNYLNFSDHRYYNRDQDLDNFHYSVLNSYVQNKEVKNRELTALDTLKFFKILQKYEKKIGVIHKGKSDIKAISNTYKLYNLIDTYGLDTNNYNVVYPQSIISVDRNLEIKFLKSFDIEDYNNISHILFGSAKLNDTFTNVLKSNIYKQTILSNQDNGMLAFKKCISINENRKPHDPVYDLIATFFVAVMFNLSIVHSFSV